MSEKPYVLRDAKAEAVAGLMRSRNLLIEDLYFKTSKSWTGYPAYKKEIEDRIADIDRQVKAILAQE